MLIDKDTVETKDITSEQDNEAHDDISASGTISCQLWVVIWYHGLWDFYGV